MVPTAQDRAAALHAPPAASRPPDRPAPAADAPGAGARAFYARALPLLTLALLVWFVVDDSVLTHDTADHEAFGVTWGLRTIASRSSPDDARPLVHGYGDAAARIRDATAAMLGDDATPRQRQAALDKEAAYRSIGDRGLFSLAVLGVGALFLVAGAWLRRPGLWERFAFLLLGVGTAAFGVLWFRWSFARVEASLAHAAEGRYGFAPSAVLLLAGFVAAALAGAALCASARRPR